MPEPAYHYRQLRYISLVLVSRKNRRYLLETKRLREG